MEYISLIILLGIASVFNIRIIKKKQITKALIPYLFLVAITVTLGFIYYQNPYNQSIARFFIKIIN